MIRVLALLGAAMAGAYGVTAGIVDPGEIMDLPTALLGFAAATVMAVVALRFL